MDREECGSRRMWIAKNVDPAECGSAKNVDRVECGSA